MRYKLNWADLKGGLRTAGALMIGNTMVGVTIFNKTLESLWLLLVFGLLLLVGNSINRNLGDKP